MTEPRNRKGLGNSREDTELANPPIARPESKPPASTNRTIRRISPLGFRVVVKIRPSENITDTGLYLPEGARASAQESLIAEVVEVASASASQMDEEDTNISGIPLHALVLIFKDAGVRVPWDDSLRIVDSKDVLALVHEMRLV